MMAIRLISVVAILGAALVTATGARAFSDERARCAEPIPRNATIYRPECGAGDEQQGNLALPPALPAMVGA
jgi:hypothetical protein